MTVWGGWDADIKPSPWRGRIPSRLTPTRFQMGPEPAGRFAISDDCEYNYMLKFIDTIVNSLKSVQKTYGNWIYEILNA
jgi:hypothetical protein